MTNDPHRFVDVVFDRPPGPVAPCFVQVEDASGQSIRFGTWVERADGTWALRIPLNDARDPAPLAQPIDAQVRMIKP
jgi:hypothetical protein